MLHASGQVAFLRNQVVAGQGSSETARIDQSIKYLNNFGPFRIEAMYGQPNTSVNQFYQGSIGVARLNFSVDLMGGHASDLVSPLALAGRPILVPRLGTGGVVSGRLRMDEEFEALCRRRILQVQRGFCVLISEDV